MPEGSDVGPELQDAKEIVHGPAPKLREVRFFKVSAELIESKVDSLDASDEPGDDLSSDEGSDVSVNLDLRTRQAEQVLAVRIALTASSERWRVLVDVSAEFEAKHPFATSERARVDFADKVGVMTLYPYMRETVGSLTLRTFGEGFLLPTISLGDISFVTKRVGTEI